MANPNDVQAEFRRLLILQLLEQDSDYSINDTILSQLLKAQGHGVAMAVLRADLAWLERIGLIGTNPLPGTTVAILRNDGLDVANGLAVVPGVARPRPE